ncbi:MAG TPA: hypothetical protein VGN72_21400 [Tepidisphaeraceae bacterium]|nr:hypothetical protein [Tepidisphaeraceae bacterium]
MSIERVTEVEERFLHWLSWAALVAATIIACAVCWQLWQSQGRVEMLTRGKTHLLPLGMRALLATPALVFAVVPISVAAACVAVQTRLQSRVVTTLSHLFVMCVGLGCLLLTRDMVMAGSFNQTFGGPAGR